ncbi:hypothetical protein IQ07DRAFT_361924 [Pyrenochaeta sp. DS3sAY3a]|nr:hypothetical protein IQ07DRAFT_361924 [Pyrenochaeta sp. DS3sAY3a]
MTQAPASTCRAQRTREKTLAIVIKAALDGSTSEDIQHRVDVERSSSFFGSVLSSITSCFTSTTSKSSDDPNRLSISCNLNDLCLYPALLPDCKSSCACSGHTLCKCCIVSAPSVPEEIRQSIEPADAALPKAISPIARPNTPSSTAEPLTSSEDGSLRYPCVYPKCEYSAYNDRDRIQHGKKHEILDVACSRLAIFACDPSVSVCIGKLITSNTQVSAFRNSEFRPSIQKDDSDKPRTGYRCPNSNCAARF